LDEDYPDTIRIEDVEDSIEKRIYEKVQDALEKSPSPQKIDIRHEALRIAQIIREEVERENQMSIDKKNKKTFFDDITVTRYQEQESIDSLSQRTDQVNHLDIPASIHQETLSEQSLNSSPTI
jgi:hypothetical protein